MWALRTCRRTWRAWGVLQHECLCSRLRVHVVSTQSCVNSWPSCHLQCRTYLFSRETAVNLLIQGAWEALLPGNLAGFLVRARKLICLHVFCVRCVWQSPSTSLVTREYELLAHRGSFLRGPHPSIFCCEVCDDWSCASQLHCAESIAAKHARTRLCIHATKASKWPLKHHVTCRLAVAIAGLSWRGGLWCLQLR